MQSGQLFGDVKVLFTFRIFIEFFIFNINNVIFSNELVYKSVFNVIIVIHRWKVTIIRIQCPFISRRSLLSSERNADSVPS